MARRRLPLSAVVVATLVAVAAAVGVYAALAGSGGNDGAATGQAGAEGAGSAVPAPTGALPGSVEEVRLAALDGGADRTLGEFVGDKPVVLNVFASWCGPCLEEMPDFEAVHQALGDRVGFVGLASQDRPDRANAMVERTGVTYPSFGDPDASGVTYFGVITLPATVFIDAAGEVVEVVSRPLTQEQLRQRIAENFGIAP